MDIIVTCLAWMVERLGGAFINVSCFPLVVIAGAGFHFGHDCAH